MRLDELRIGLWYDVPTDPMRYTGSVGDQAQFVTLNNKPYSCHPDWAKRITPRETLLAYAESLDYVARAQLLSKIPRT
jgi:hypothetical protein